MTPKVYNAQSRLLDSVAMISWPKSHQEKIKWSESYKESCKKSKFADFDGSIIFKSVGFNYPKSPFIFKDINLDIKKNECIGIIGKSGIGKSTLIDLMTGLVKPKKGLVGCRP